MEETLDQIARGNADRVAVLSAFYFGQTKSDDGDVPTPTEGHEGLHQLVTELGDIDARSICTFPIGDSVVVRVGRYGTYVEDSEGNRANVDDTLPPDELTIKAAKELLASPNGQDRELGLDPHSHRPIVARNGRFGPYVTEVLDDEATEVVETTTKDGKKRRTKRKVKPRTACSSR